MKTWGPFCLLHSYPDIWACDWQHTTGLLWFFSFFNPPNTQAYKHTYTNQMHVCVTLKRRGTELRGERKLSSRPQEVGLPQGCVCVIEALGRGLKADASCCKDMNCLCVLVSAEAVSRLKCRWKWMYVTNTSLCRCESQVRNLVGFSHGS